MWQFSEHDVVTEKSASVNRTNIPPMNFRYGFSLLQITGLRDQFIIIIIIIIIIIVVTWDNDR